MHLGSGNVQNSSLKLQDSPLSDVRPRVLLVEDDRASLLSIEAQFSDLGYAVETAGNGAEAYAMLKEDAERADIVVTDRMMPVLDGLALTRRLKREPATMNIPVVMLTGATTEDEISAGIEAGAFYYLTKPPVPGLVASVLASAMQEVKRQSEVRSQVGAHQAAFQNMQIARFTLSRPHEVEPVVSMLASMHSDPQKAIQGIFELIQNGVEHGIYRLGLSDKIELVKKGQLQGELARRARDPVYAHGRVEATGVRRDDGIVFTVKDNGPGFNWRPFMRSDPTRSNAVCGRGITRAANFAFARVNYNEAGNVVAAFLPEKERVKW